MVTREVKLRMYAAEEREDGGQVVTREGNMRVVASEER